MVVIIHKYSLNESIKWINVEAKVSMEQTKEANGRGWKQNLNEKQQQPKFRSETKKCRPWKIEKRRHLQKIQIFLSIWQKKLNLVRFFLFVAAAIR